MNEALLPCPFCGAECHFEIDDEQWQWVECGRCKMQSNRSVSLMEDCKPKLTAAWNCRAAIAAAQSQSDTHPAVTYFPTAPVQGIAAFGPGTSVVQPAADEIINMAREQGLPETETEGVFIVNADDLGRIFASYRAARAPAERLPVNWMAEVERVICRMNSSDPDFDDCADAVALIIRLTAEVTGPKGYATWKDAAVAERIRANRVLEDAARYRWLAKEHGGLLLRHFPAMRPYIDASEVIDEAIDAARKQGASHESST